MCESTAVSGGKNPWVVTFGFGVFGFFGFSVKIDRQIFKLLSGGKMGFRSQSMVFG